jgi:hypothetical protein
MGIGGRIMSTLTTGFRAGLQTWQGYTTTPLTPYDNNGRELWDDYNARMYRYYVFRHYYDNTVYTAQNRHAERMKEQNKWYKFIRGVHNPIKRYVETYVSFVYSGSLDYNNPGSGAIPVSAEDNVTDAIVRLWRDSQWQDKKSLYVRNGALLGDMAIKLVDDRQRGNVRMEVLQPHKIRHAKLDALGNVQEIIIEYERLEDKQDVSSRTYTYTEHITPEQFSTYKDGELYAYYNDAAGMPVAQWANEYGFVPVSLGKFSDEGFTFGVPGYAGTSLYKINEINDVASLLNDNIRKSVNTIWVASGADKGTTLDASKNDRDKSPILYMPQQATLTPLVFPLDIAQTSARIQDMLTELQADMPELALATIRDNSSRMTQPGVNTGWADGEARIIEARGMFDGALVRAQMMAMAMGGFNNYTGYEAFSLDDYINGNLQHSIKPRPVIDDTLGKSEVLNALLQGGVTLPTLMKYAGFSDGEIEDETVRQEERSRAEVGAFSAGLLRDLMTDTDEENTDDGQQTTANTDTGTATDNA